MNTKDLKVLVIAVLMLCLCVGSVVAPHYSKKWNFEISFGVQPENDPVTTGLVLHKLDASYNNCMLDRMQYKIVVDNASDVEDNKKITTAQQREISCWKKHNEMYSLAKYFNFINKE